ncbi:venom serine carboxypeptidase-like [Cylas formicarius]|uniref:venom serine carboxypeptidase-like n=1 Tax=Cylas formicarius TaxID=197179 RepID=UPI002958CCA6|nr:venom serine carboxypeptidase-like [Cylas formicarius]
MSNIINLKGLAIGDGLSDPKTQLVYSDQLYHFGLVDENGREIIKEYERRYLDAIENEDFVTAFMFFAELMFGTASGSAVFQTITGYSSWYNLLQQTISINFTNINLFLQDEVVREAIHVGNNTFNAFNIEVLEHFASDFMQSVSDLVEELLEEYPVLIYSGHLDIIVPYPQTVKYLSSLNFTGAEEYSNAERKMLMCDDNLAAYVKRGGNLTEVMVLNAGHYVLLDQPRAKGKTNTFRRETSLPMG